MSSSLIDRVVVRPDSRAVPVGEPVHSSAVVVYPELSIDEAKRQVGAALRLTLKRSDIAYKEIGDSGNVTRVCDGDVPTWLAQIWRRPHARKALVMILADLSGQFETKTTISER